MSKTYQICFLGLAGEKGEFCKKMEGLRADLNKVDLMLLKAPLVIRRGLSLRDARRYAEAIQDAGGKVSIREFETHEDTEPAIRRSIPSLEQFTMCPECGLKQLRANRCVRCGCLLGRGGGR